MKQKDCYKSWIKNKNYYNNNFKNISYRFLLKNKNNNNWLHSSRIRVLKNQNYQCIKNYNIKWMK